MVTDNNKAHNEEHLPKNLHYDKLLICLLVGAVIWFLPIPNGINPQAWHLLAIFIATILGLIINPLPMGALAIVATSIALVTNTITLNNALEGFSNSVAWLVVIAFFIAKSFIVTNLGSRLAFFFTKIFGKKSLGLGYSIGLTNFIMAPVIPSATGCGNCL